MKILVLSDTFQPDVAGGADVAAFRLSKGFARQGHEVGVVTTTTQREKEGMTSIEGLVVWRIYSAYHERWRAYLSLWNPWVIPEVKQVLTIFKPDIVHVHNVHMHLSYGSLLVAKRYARKVFMTAHDIMPFYPGTFTEFIGPENLSCPDVFNYRINVFMLIRKFRFRYNPFRNAIIRQILKRIDGVVTVSHALEDALEQNGISVRAVIPNGIEVSEWIISRSEAESFKQSLGLAGTEIVLFQGRLSGAKGGTLILEAMREVVRRVPTARLLVVGHKDFYAERMHKKAVELGIGDAVVFAGWLCESDMKKAYATATVVVVPSVCFDSSPNGNWEAFASKKPVVATCFGGSRELVRDGENGFIVNPYNIVSLEESITDLLEHPDKARTFGEHGYARVLTEFASAAMAERYLVLFS
jgi:glycosyltransferase involved in cell wall biosynthesis